MMIEKVTGKDAKALLEIYRPYVEHTAITFEEIVPSVEEFACRIQAISKKYPYIKCVEQGKIVGYAYANTFKDRSCYDFSVECTVYVRKEHRQKGVGKLLYAALEKSLLAMGVTNVNACIACKEEEDEFLPKDSVLFHQKMGYALVGTFHGCANKFNRWYDMCWMEKQIAPHAVPPEKVRFGEWTLE